MMCKTHKKQPVFGMKDTQSAPVGNFLDTLLEAIPIPIFFKDIHGRYLGCNQAFEKLLGINRNELINKTVFDVNPCTLAEVYCAQDNKLFQTGGTQEYESQIQNTKHEIRDVVFKKGTFSDHTGNVQGLIGVVLDVTEKNKAEHIRLAHQRRLRSLAAKLALAQDTEQRRIAEGLHDDVAQILSACSIQLSLVHGTQDLQKVSGIVQESQRLIALANERIRQLCFELTSSTLYKLGLHAALEELCEGIKARYGVSFSVHGNGYFSTLDDESSTVLFKAVRELIFNVIKHAEVQEGKVSINCTDTFLQMTVEDHGKGFAQKIENIEPGSGKGLGLFGIQERLKDLGGTLHIQSIPNKITQVTLSVPLNTK